MTIKTPWGGIRIDGRDGNLWQYRLAGSRTAVNVAAPEFEIDGKPAVLVVDSVRPVRKPVRLRNGVTELVVAGVCRGRTDLRLEMVFRVADDNPVVRFCYRLVNRGAAVRLTKSTGCDRIVYAGLSLAAWPECGELRLSEFDDATHSYCPRERAVTAKDFDNGLTPMGPILTASDGRHSLLLAYEHGSQAPDAFLQYRLHPDRRVSLEAAKGNYWDGQSVGDGADYETVWFELAVVAGDREALAAAYRAFVLGRMTENAASRSPYIFYNTWAFQERNFWWNKKRYLDSMTQERMLAEIDVAHRMGIDVFVLDTGWYEKTGDWRVNRARFPDGLKAVREKLAGYGMKLGLWFSPTEAAVTSRMLTEHKDCLMSQGGRANAPHAVWESEDSQCLCLVSRYWEAFADELIRLVKEVGVTYFKWDAVGQYGCDDARHGHGGAGATAQERADVYAFEQVRYMTRVIDRLCAACPEAIVDFDITEGGRSVGLAFLAAGKYFLINNGPYYHNYDIPRECTTGTWSNIFVYPGPARAWICRAPLTFDRWIPSVLFLSHYLPDDPEGSQLINIGSLILGQNGIWGDLLSVSDEGVARFGRWLGLYKQVRDDITAASPVFDGTTGGSPEVYEKISAATGRGAVVMFASAGGSYTYVTTHAATREHTATAGAAITHDGEGRAVIRATFEKAGAAIVFFGATA